VKKLILDGFAGAPSLTPALTFSHARRGAHNVLLSQKLASFIAIAAAYATSREGPAQAKNAPLKSLAQTGDLYRYMNLSLGNCV
jgi:hypothetical protein